MSDSDELRVPKWPFFLGDALMLGLAYYIYWQQDKMPLSLWEVVAGGICVLLGAGLAITPYILEYRALIKYGALTRLIETSALCAAMEKIQNLETLVGQINTASDQWQNAQTHADKTAVTAKEISERMAAELKDFTTFMQKANEGEKSTLRLEVEKLRRAENEWLNILVFILDHIFALNRAAERSGQQNLVTQLGQFQNACRDAARRVGLIPVLAEFNETFDSKRHQTSDGTTPTEGAVVAEVLATGYSFQGRLLRPVVVRCEDLKSPKKLAPEKPAAAQDQLPLESPGAA